MKLYDLKRGDVFVIKESIFPPGAMGVGDKEPIRFDHLDGMYSFCKRVSDGAVVHPVALAEVEIIKDEAAAVAGKTDGSPSSEAQKEGKA